ncbi:hypothetical protein [Thalassospira sp. MCCC 1A01428]|uniref:hypothetical protein n=1 Tax=Thalassospira sp. MCCC 1A01428 TaxID=1470575 RepID=UPI00111C6C65|nr:hypothetical protein [Thalassospira sp. MCCC 1A01428]
MLVALLVKETPKAVPYALIHDAHEAYINDLSLPFKQVIREINPDAWNSIKAIQEGFDIAIHAAAGLTYPAPDKIAKLVKQADHTALLIESRDLMTYLVHNPQNISVPAKKIKNSPPANAGYTLMQHFQMYLPRLADRGAVA